MAEVVSKTASLSLNHSPLSSSSSSTESSFRELDDVFLQSQAKIWIGEVLQTRLSEELNIADMLSDGELLYEVSREIWSMLATKRMELRGLRPHKYDPFVSRKSSGRYRPYSNVDSFLKVCKILGLAGIDLFSPSDVVEKRNTRKVCMCIRSLSKKVRSRQLNVPDFDIVTYTVAMPTDMVGYIRRSWEMSHCSPSSSASSSCHSSYHNSRQSRRQNQSLADSERKYDMYNEESDEADSDFTFPSDRQTSSFSYDASSCVNFELLDSHEVSSVPKDYSCERGSSNTQKQEADEYHKCCCEAESFLRSMESLFSQNEERDHQEHCTSSPLHSNAQFESIVPHSLDMRYVDSNIEDNASVVGDSDGNTPASNEFRGQSDFSIFMFDRAYRNDYTLLHREDDNSHACANTGSSASKTSLVNRDHECSSRNSDDNIDVSSVASMSSTSDAVQILDANDHIHAEEYFRNLSLDKASFGKLDSGKSYMEESKFQEKTAHETGEHGLTSVGEDASIFDMLVSNKHHETVCEESENLINDHSQVDFHQWDMKGKCRASSLSVMDDNHITSSMPPSQVNSQKDVLIQTKASEDASSHDDKKSNIPSNDASVKNKTSSESGTREALTETETFSVNEHIHNVGKISDQVSETRENDRIEADDDAYGVCCDDNNAEKFQDPADNEEKSKEKPQRRLLIKSVASGTAVLGAVWLFIHLRKTGGQKTGKSDKQSSQTRKANSRDISLQKERKGSRSNGVYPSEKLKFGN